MIIVRLSNGMELQTEEGRQVSGAITNNGTFYAETREVHPEDRTTWMVEARHVVATRVVK